MRFIFLIYVAFLLLSPLYLHALPEVILDKNIDSYTDFKIEYFHDIPNSKQNIHTIKALPFKESSNKFSKGYYQRALWLRFSIKNNLPKQHSIIVEVTEPFHKTTEFYIQDKVLKSGLSVPLKQRIIKEYNPSLKLNFSALEQKVIYIKLESDYGLFGSVVLKEPEIFYTDTKQQNNFMIFYFGAVLIIALYNLFIFFYLQEKIYIYYVGYVLFFAIWASLYSGIASNYFNIQGFNLLQFSVPAFVIMLILFTQSILQTKNYYPKIHTVLKGFIFLLALSLIWILMSVHTGFYFMNIVAAPLLPLLLYISIHASLRGHKLAKIYTIALVTYIISMSFLSLLSLGLIPYSSLIRNAPIVGSLIEIVLFSLALAYRINLFRQEKLDSQSLLLKHEQTQSIRLAQMVEQQTAALTQANHQLKIQASTDFLTGIKNRKAFFEACHLEVDRVQRYGEEPSFLILDIDLFKSVNDTYGHLVGDKVLIAVTKEITLQLRTTDIFGRIGGEEFAILMPNTTMKDTLLLAERIRKSVEEIHLDLKEEVLNISISIGVSQYLKDENLIQPAFKRADKALYKAKENGRNQVCSSLS